MHLKRLFLPLVLALEMGAMWLLLGPHDNLAAPRQVTSAPMAGELVGHLGIAGEGVFVVGNRAYVTSGPELAVLDVSDPAHPRRIGYAMLSDNGQTVYVSGHYAYVGGEYNHFWIVDISEPAAPAVVGSYFAYSWAARGVYVAGDYAYVVGENFSVLDVSDPANPVLAGSCTLGSDKFLRDVYVVGDYAYVAGDAGLHVVDISNPTAPVEVGALEASSTGIHVAGQYAYLTDFEITVKSQLLVVDISDPAHPQSVGVADGLFGVDGPWGELDDVYVAGDYAYVSGKLRSPSGLYIGGIQIVDISNPTAPQLRETYLEDEIDYPRQVGVGGNDVFLASHNADLRVIDVSDPDNPARVGVYPALSDENTAILVSGNYAYINAAWGDTLDIADVSNLANPVMAGRYRRTYQRSTTNRAFSAPTVKVTGLALVPPYLYQMGIAGLRVLDVSDPAQPQETGRYDVSGGTDVAVEGNIACLSSYEHGLRVLDVTDPSHPTLLGSYGEGDSAQAVAISGSKAYLAVNAQLLILDISDPANPTPLGEYDAPGNREYVRDLLLAGQYAYLSTSEALRIIDVGDPHQPKEKGNIAGDWKALSFDAARSYLYIGGADYLGGDMRVRIMDVSDPAAPVEVGSYATDVGGGYVAGDYVYVVNKGGMSIIRMAPPSLNITPDSVFFLATAGGPDPAPRPASIGSHGGPLTWTATLSPTVGWLAAAPLSGTTPATITVTAHITGLAASHYTSTLVISSPQVSDPQRVPITLIVADEVYDLSLPLVLRSR